MNMEDRGGISNFDINEVACKIEQKKKKKDSNQVEPQKINEQFQDYSFNYSFNYDFSNSEIYRNNKSFINHNEIKSNQKKKS